MFTLYLNPEKSPVAVQAKANGSLVSALKFKRGAIVPLRVIVLGSTAAAQLRIGIKAKNAFESNLLVYAEAATGIAVENGIAFDLSLSISSTALNDALDVGEGAAISPASLQAMTEFSWLEDGDARISDTLTTTVYNDILRLANEAPEAAAGEYPAPDLVATKSWVNNLRASAADAGLVLLEADAILVGEYTAVALTSNGTIAVPMATATESGTVVLGTDEVLNGRNVLPIGKDAEGKLAVSADGLSAFDSAKKAGFVGTEVEWIASLKGEKGDTGAQGIQGEKGDTGEVDPAIVYEAVHEAVYGEALVSHTSAEGTVNINCFWAQLSAVHCPPEGSLKSISIPCRSDSNAEMTTTAAYLGVFEENAGGEFVHIGTSKNSVVQQIGTDGVWLFDDVHLSGTKLRLSLMPNRTTTTLSSSLVLSGKGVYRDSDGCYLQNTSGSNESYLLGASFVIGQDSALFTPVSHTSDTVAHLTEEEHTQLSELLFHKEALLALLNT